MNENPSEPASALEQAPRRSSNLGIWFLVAGLAVIGGWVLLTMRGPGPTGQSSVAVGKPAPQVDLVRLPTGAAVDPELEGRVTLLHFWGTWCGPCRMEYPQLSATMNELSQDSGFQFVPVSCESGPGETIQGLAEKTSEYFARENITSVSLADPRGITRQSAAERLGQTSLYYPTSLLIGPDGKIAGVWEGYAPGSVEQIAQSAKGLLAQP